MVCRDFIYHVDGVFDRKSLSLLRTLRQVQGDERDTTIFGIPYCADAQGRLLHNFGPLNRVEGERRLNVAVTRAKCNVQLVSSMNYTDIDLKRTSSEGAKLTFFLLTHRSDALDSELILV